MSARRVLGPAVLLLGLLLSGATPSKQHGIALGLFAEDPSFSYEPLLKEIASTGASHVSLIVPYYQHSLHSTQISAHPRFSPSDATVLRAIQDARRAGLKIFLFPILRLEYALTVEEWRGSIDPNDPDAWWKNYSAFILKFARLAAAHHVEAFCIGSELNSLDTTIDRWTPLFAKVRRVYSGTLVYSANWDHYDRVAIWPLVDMAGLSAYFPLTDGQRSPPLRRLVQSWRDQYEKISRWQSRIGKPLIFTELGYHSQDLTNAFPWDESADKPINLQEQADCYESFIRVFGSSPILQGVYFWNWFGWGGPKSREYCPRGKPAAQVICDWFGVKPAACPRKSGLP